MRTSPDPAAPAAIAPTRSPEHRADRPSSFRERLLERWLEDFAVIVVAALATLHAEWRIISNPYGARVIDEDDGVGDPAGMSATVFSRVSSAR
jgi:hypothetical protein